MRRPLKAQRGPRVLRAKPPLRNSIVIADDHSLLVEAIALILKKAGFDVVGTASTGEEAISLAGSLKPNFLLLDISMPRTNGLEALTTIRQHAPATKIVMLTMHMDPDMAAEALSRGADGYLLKVTSKRDLLECLSEVQKGTTYVSRELRIVNNSKSEVILTRVERILLQTLREETETGKIAPIFGVDEERIRVQLQRLVTKLQLKSVEDLIQYARINTLEE
jgi:DNA-binding NarL/FixJ family response regulator